jgi:hypothetical protein
LLAEGIVCIWRFGSGSGDGLRLSAVAIHRSVPVTTISI